MYVRLLDNEPYAVTEDARREIEGEKRKRRNVRRNFPTVTKANTGTKIKCAIIILVGVSVFVLIASTSIPSGWLWLLGILGTIALAIVTRIWWLALGEERFKSAWNSPAVAGFAVVLFVAAMAMFVLAPSIHQWAKSNHEESSKVAQISDLRLFYKNRQTDTYSFEPGIYPNVDGYISAIITNTTHAIRDYEITIERWKPAEEWKKGDPRNRIFELGGEDYTKPKYLETVGTVKIAGVQPGEQRSWERLLFSQGSLKGLDWWEWRVSVGGWSWAIGGSGYNAR